MLAVSSALALACCSSATDTSMCHGRDGWRVTFEDEFDGSAINESNWAVFDNRTHGDVEKQLYMASEARVENGSLILISRKLATPLWRGKKHYNFSSGWVQSAGKRFQRFGRFEVRRRRWFITQMATQQRPPAAAEKRRGSPIVTPVASEITTMWS